jgi:hypothetical protein
VSAKRTPCTCGHREPCQPRELLHRYTPPAPGRGDPAEHYATVAGTTDQDWRLWGYAKLWARDGDGSPWHAEYWRTWDRAVVTSPPLPTPAPAPAIPAWWIAA